MQPSTVTQRLGQYDHEKYLGRQQRKQEKLERKQKREEQTENAIEHKQSMFNFNILLNTAFYPRMLQQAPTTSLIIIPSLR